MVFTLESVSIAVMSDDYPFCTFAIAGVSNEGLWERERGERKRRRNMRRALYMTI